MLDGLDAIGFYKSLSGAGGVGRLRVFSFLRNPNPYKPAQSDLTIHLDTECVGFRLQPIGEGGDRGSTGVDTQKDYRCSIAPEGAEVLQLGQFCQVQWKGTSIKGILDKIDRKYTKRVVLIIDASKNVPVTLDA